MTQKVNKAIFSILQPFFLVVCFFSLFKGVFGSLLKTHLFEYFDEIISVFSLVILAPIYLIKPRLKVVYFILGIFVIYSIVVSLIFGVSGTPTTIFFQTLISIKFFIVLLALLELFRHNYKLLQRFFLFVVGFALLGFGLHLLLGVRFNNLLEVPTFARPAIRYVGFFTHPNHMAYMVLAYVAYVLNKKYTREPLGYLDWITIAIAVGVILLTDSRTAILAIGILLAFFYWELIKKNYKLVLGVVAGGFLGLIYLLFFTDMAESISRNIRDTFNLSSSYIRGNMIYLSGLIFRDYFPIGTGASTFGSVLSDDTVYALYGQAHRYYFVNKIGLYDCNIASIVGEYGFMGIILFTAMFIYLNKYLKGFSKEKSFIGAFLLVFLFYSITNPMLTNNLYAILSAIVLLLFAYRPPTNFNKQVLKL